MLYNFFKNKYDAEKSDNIYGKTIILKDVCSDEQYSFLVENNVDRGILLNKLNSGFYRVYVMEDLIKKRMTYTETLNAVIHTNNANREEMKVTIMADKNLGSTAADKNYVFIKVEASKLAKKAYDIALDPAGNDSDLTYTVSKGSEGNGLVEATESYQACLKLKKALEDNGFKVLIVRDKNEEIDSYGKSGRLARAYKAKARYYFHIGFSENSNKNYSGFEISYSAHSSKILASQIVYTVDKKTPLAAGIYYSGEDKAGLIPATLVEGKDGRSVYDNVLWVREAGGLATQAGMYSDNAESSNGSFAKNNRYGMNGLNISIGYLTNNDDATAWKNHSDEICKQISNAISAYLHPGD